MENEAEKDDGSTKSTVVASPNDLVFSDETLRISSYISNLNLTGEFYRDYTNDYTQDKTDRLYFVDFDTVNAL